MVYLWFYKFFRYVTFVWAYHSQALINKSLLISTRSLRASGKRKSTEQILVVTGTGIKAWNHCMPVTDKFFSFPLLASPPAALVHWGIFELIIKESGDEGSDGKGRKSVTSLSRSTFVPIIPLWHFSLVSLGLDCEAVGFFFLKISKEIGKAWRKSLTRAKRASLTRPSISLSLRRGL